MITFTVQLTRIMHALVALVSTTRVWSSYLIFSSSSSSSSSSTRRTFGTQGLPGDALVTGVSPLSPPCTGLHLNHTCVSEFPLLVGLHRFVAISCCSSTNMSRFFVLYLNSRFRAFSKEETDTRTAASLDFEPLELSTAVMMQAIMVRARAHGYTCCLRGSAPDGLQSKASRQKRRLVKDRSLSPMDHEYRYDITQNIVLHEMGFYS